MTKSSSVFNVSKANLRIIESAIEQLETDADGLERCHPDHSCHGYAARIRDCTNALRDAHKGLKKILPTLGSTEGGDDEDFVPTSPQQPTAECAGEVPAAAS